MYSLEYLMEFNKAISHKEFRETVFFTVYINFLIHLLKQNIYSRNMQNQARLVKKPFAYKIGNFFN